MVLRKLRQFQDLGHTAVLVIGDYTARVGDPSGRSKTRPILSPEQIEENTRTYLEQAYLILEREGTEVRRNSKWLAPMRMSDVIELTPRSPPWPAFWSATTLANVRCGRPDHADRGYSILCCGLRLDRHRRDVEIGGTDQLYNLLMGRHIMEYYGKKPQCVLTTPLLVGTDGTAKMSKSLGNYIGVTDDPREMFGKAMSIPDEAMADYYSLVLGQDPPEAPPVEQKRELARSWFAFPRRGGHSDARSTSHGRPARGPEDAPEGPA